MSLNTGNTCKILNLLGTGYKHPFIGYYIFLYSEFHSIKIIADVPIRGLKLTKKYKSVSILAILKIVRWAISSFRLFFFSPHLLLPAHDFYNTMVLSSEYCKCTQIYFDYQIFWKGWNTLWVLLEVFLLLLGPWFSCETIWLDTKRKEELGYGLGCLFFSNQVH